MWIFCHCLFYIISHFKWCMYFIHWKLVKDGSFSCIIQPNIDNFVLLVTEQSPCPGEVNSPLRQPTASSHLLRPMGRGESASQSSLGCCCLGAGHLPLPRSPQEDKVQGILLWCQASPLLPEHLPGSRTWPLCCLLPAMSLVGHRPAPAARGGGSLLVLNSYV